MKIEKGKPLPNHTKLDYEECYAKVVLESLFPEQYSEMLIKDKPDLINDSLSVGVEVTSAIPQKHREAVKLWYMMPYVNEKQAERNKERMKQLGVDYQGGIQTWPPRYYSPSNKKTLEEIFWVFETKVNKLNSGQYRQVQRYDLFISSEIWLLDEQVPKMLNGLVYRNVGEFIYTFVYLITSDDIYVFDLINKKYHKILYDVYHELQFAWAMEARKMVEDGELK